MRRAEVICGDLRTVLPTMAENSVDSVCTDPPYELGFMGKRWDASGVSFDPETWRAVLRVLRPGGHILAFGGSRTFHRIAVALEDAGGEVRDVLSWIYAQGFPKSLDVSKAIDKHLGAERPVVGHAENWGRTRLADGKVGLGDYAGEWAVTAPATAPATAYSGFGTALKPAWEPILVIRKHPNGSIAANVLAYGTGALNIDGTRIPMTDADADAINQAHAGMDVKAYDRPAGVALGLSVDPMPLKAAHAHELGRWPANVVMSHGDGCTDEACEPGCPVAELDRQSGESVSTVVGEERAGVPLDTHGDGWGFRRAAGGYSDKGTAARFFYIPKPARSERERGCRHLPGRSAGEVTGREDGTAGLNSPRAGAGRTKGARNFHPTVKPIELMRWLVRLVTPPGGVVLDPFCGSGSTGVAALEEGFDFIGIDQSAEYCDIARARIAAAQPHQLPLIPPEAA